jgi:hypothetical protein
VAYRVEEHPRFLTQLRDAPDEAMDLLTDIVYPQLRIDPTGERGNLHGLSYDQASGLFILTLRGDRGGSGFVSYQVLEDERLVMVFDFLWLPG